MQNIHPVAQYLLALAATIAAYGGYASWVAPRIEGGPPVVRGVGSVEMKPAEDNRPAIELAPWIPADSWELGPCKTLRNGETTLYCRDYVTLDDGSIQIYPLTIILGSENSAEPPVIIRAFEQAILKFDRPLTMGGGEGPGRLLHARMPGPVELIQPGSSGHPDGGIFVRTSNLQLTPQRIYTIEPVEFTHGGSHGSGRNLMLDLAHTTPPGAINTGFSTVNGISRMELAFVDYLELVSGSASGAANGSSPAAVAEPLSENQASLQSARIHCAGPLVFDFQKQTALFRDDVVVRSLDDSGDVLTGDQLEVTFDRAELVAPGPSPNRNGTAFPKLKPRRIAARGQPARLLMPGRKSSAVGEMLEYDLALQQIRASDSRAVIVHQDQQEFVTRSLEYRIRSDGSLGPMMAGGPGRLVSAGGDSASATAGDWTVTFQTSLVVQPEPDGKIITLSGDATIQLDAQQKIRGEQIRLWLNQQQVQSDSPNSSMQWQYTPARMEVDGSVNIAMDGLQGLTGKLIAIWNDLPIHAAGSGHRIGFDSAPQKILPASFVSGAARPGVAATAGAAGIHQALRPVFDDPPARNDLNFRGDQVTVQLVRRDNPADPAGAGKTEVQQVEIDGHVVVEQVSRETAEAAAAGDPSGIQAGNRERDLLVTGNRMNLTPVADEMWRAHVSGDVVIDSPQMVLRGDDVHMDQASNRIWIVGAGDLEMKPQENRPRVPALQASNPSAPDPEETRFDSMTVSWIGGMIFDGGRVWFEQQVRSEARQTSAAGVRSTVRSLSEGMTLTLDRQIVFQDQQSESSQPAPRIRQLTMIDRLTSDQKVFDTPASAPPASGSVVLERLEQDSAGQNLTRQVIVVPQIDYNISTGDILARGPGGIINWQPGSADDQPFGQQRPPAPRAAAGQGIGIACLHVNFDRQLTANSRRSEMEIQGNVRAAFGNVDSWDSRISPERTPPAAGITRMVCQQVRMVSWQRVGADSPAMDLVATGDALIESEAFRAVGAVIRYAGDSGKMILEGDNRSDANLWYSASGSRDRDHLVAGKITYYPETQAAEIDKVQSATLNRNGR